MKSRIERGQILKNLREAKGLRQSDVAQKMGVTQQAYQRYEQGTSEPNADGFAVLADLYSVTTDYLLGRSTGEPTVVEKIAAQFDMTALEQKILEGYLNLPPDKRDNVMDFLSKAVREVQSESKSDSPPTKEMTYGEYSENQVKKTVG